MNASYHRSELDMRITKFEGECQKAVNSIESLKIHARSFLDTLHCDRTELKDRFLWCTRQLDEYMYLVTEFNLSATKFAEEHDWHTAVPKDQPLNNGQSGHISHQIRTSQSKQTGIQDLGSYNKGYVAKMETNRLVPSQIQEQLPHNAQTGRASRRKKKSKEDLLQLSSYSCSAESLCEDAPVEAANEINEIDTETLSAIVSLAPQSALDASCDFACISSADEANLWLVTDMAGLTKLVNDMTEFYNAHNVPALAAVEVPELACCVYFDEETRSYFRGIPIKTQGEGEVYLVDTGETRALRTPRPLAGRFSSPALAHLCHLADVDLPEEGQLADIQARFLSKYVWEEFRIELQEFDNSSQSQGVYIYLENGTSLNQLLMEELASAKLRLESSCPASEQSLDKPPAGRPTERQLDDEDLEYGPEHENPLEAVTGYSNQDEVTICKHYRGGADRTCFKGSRCKKRHVMQHPDGWTLDRVPAVVACRPTRLPAPGTSCRVRVTHVNDVGCFYVQLESNDIARHVSDLLGILLQGAHRPYRHTNGGKLTSLGSCAPQRAFRTRRQPYLTQKHAVMTLAELVEDMTRNAVDATTLKILPALGELVSAKFSDERWYRARVTACDEERGTVEVIYIDYGNEGTVKLTELACLSPRWLTVPAAAVRCRLAGLAGGARSLADRQFTEMVLDMTLRARVIARGYDELTLELFDLEGFKVAEQLAILLEIPLQHYEVEDDTQRLCLQVPA